MEGLLSAKNSTLCFNKDDFMVNDFSVDKFVSQCRKYVSLETMLDHLGLYHKILCSAMFELLNKDYTDFVNLSSNLVGLDKSIKNLSLPLEKLKIEVEDMKNNLDTLSNTAKSLYLDYATAHKNKILAQHVLCFLEGLKKIEDLNSLIERKNDKSMSSDVFERIAEEFNVIEFLIGKISNDIVDEKKMSILEVASTLKDHLEKLFLESLSSNDISSLCKVLRIFSVINKETEIEAFFGETVVKPYMRKCLTGENILKHGVAKAYNDALDFVPKYCLNILNVTRGNKSGVDMVPGYDFLVNSVWREVVSACDLIAPVHVYAPGDPALFHANYTATNQFLEEFEHYCEVEASVERLRSHHLYKSFIEKFNLDVYFEIRIQEIAGMFESSLLDGFVKTKELHAEGGKENVMASEYSLNAVASVSECIKICWEEKVYLAPLSYSFWRLTLQLISRFCKSAHTVLNQENSLSPVEAAVIIKDVELFVNELKEFYNEHISVIIPKIAVEAAFEESIRSLEGIIPVAYSLMVNILCKACCSHLKLINDIPRLYRKTNREIPTKPSSYVSMVFKSVTEFLLESHVVLSAKWKQSCLEDVTNSIITESGLMMKDVLISIKKMEDSLKILRRARNKRGEREFGWSKVSSGTTDDDKIRRQISIDIQYLEEKIEALGVEMDRVKSFKELKVLMNSSEKTVLQNC